MTSSDGRGALRIRYLLAVLSVLIVNVAAPAQTSYRNTNTPPLAPVQSTVRGSIDQPCAVALQTDARRHSELMSGRKLVAELEQHVVLIEDLAIANYLNRLEESIVRNSDIQGCFIVKLVKDVEANAYSLPGGFLYVTSGLILLATDEAELVAALAHETGHVTARHLTKLEKQKRIWRYISFAGPVGYLFGRQVGPIFTLKSLRNAEFEADRLALQYQSVSAYDPLEFTRLLRDEFNQEGKPASFFARLFDEHPATQTRIKRITQAMQQSSSNRTDYVVDTSEFHDVKSKIAALMGIVNPELPTSKN